MAEFSTGASPQAAGIGNLFGENNAAQLAAQQAAIQRMQALQQAQLTPAQNGVYMATNAGNLFGNALGQATAKPDPRQIKLAQIKQAVDQEAEESGITSPEQYLILAASKLVQGGEYEAALKAQAEADKLMASDATRRKVIAEAEKASAEAGKQKQETFESMAKLPYEVQLAKMKANATDPESRKRIAEADQMIKSIEWSDRKFGAEIDKLYAEASKARAEATAKDSIDRESLNEQAARLIEFARLKEAKGEPVHPADIEALERITRILAQAPQPTVQSAIAQEILKEAGQNIPAPTAIPTPSGYAKDAKGFVIIPEGKPIPKDLPKGTKIRQGNRTGTVK